MFFSTVTCWGERENLSIVKNGKAKAIRFSTLEKICEVLECQPGDILVYEVKS